MRVSLLVLTSVKCVYLYVVGLTTVEESRHGSEPVGHTRSVRWKASYCRLSKPTFAMLCLGCPSLPFPPRSCSVQWNTWSPFINSCVCLDEHADSNQKVCSHYLYLQVSLRKVAPASSAPALFALNPILDQEMDRYDHIWLSSILQFRRVSASQQIYNRFCPNHFIVFKDLLDPNPTLRETDNLNCHFPEDLTSPSRNHPLGKRCDTKLL